MNSAIKSLVLTAGQHGVELSAERIMHDYALDDNRELEIADLIRIASRNRLKVKKISSNWKDVCSLGAALPVIARLKNGRYIIVSSVDSDESNPTVSILDPVASSPKLQVIPKADFMSGWSGDLVLLKSHFKILDEDQPFSMSWVFREFFAQKLLLTQTFFITMLMHVFTVLPIIYVMIVLDKVVNFQAYSTLYVIATGVLVGHFFSGIFGYLKQYISLFFVSKLEAKLNMKTFTHVMDQPLTYFNASDSTKVVKTVQQVGTIRHFLVANIFGTLLEATALLIYMPILYLFSPALFLVVFLFSLAIALNNIWGSKQQKDLQRKIAALDGLKQSTLDKAVTGIDTVKTLALEATLKRDWETSSTSHTLASLEQGKMNAKYAQISATLQQIMTVVVIFVGVLMVFDGALSAGVLIGVNMLAGKITGPLVKLVTMSTELEKFKTAVSVLEELLGSKGEQKEGGNTPVIDGGIEFKNMSFSYTDDKAVLKNINLSIKPRQSVAIIGPSGCGKTTLFRLIQGILTSSSGSISVDGHDVNLIDKEHLRINASMVSLNNTFFAKSIRENVMHPMPIASRERLFWAYKMAGLTEDLAKLPDGGETIIEENGNNLPTSMIQKIVLARALIRNPKILLLDEALSGLSVDDEIEVLNKLPEIQKGRTVVMITHQISQIIDFENIIMLNAEGELIEQGTHDELVALKGAYEKQWDKERSLRGGGQVLTVTGDKK